ncbi:MAG: hypothetical protein VW522_05085 [Candidatus Neomarinimicrobiota bacterium]
MLEIHRISDPIRSVPAIIKEVFFLGSSNMANAMNVGLKAWDK